MEKKYITTIEAAEKLGVTPGRVWHLIGDGRLAVLSRVGRSALLSRAQVERLRRTRAKKSQVAIDRP